jgi:hypothetical protein
MKLQLLRPTLVFAGAWNPAVFQLGWVAKNVHGIPVGTEVRVHEVIVTEPGRQPKKIDYMADLGIFVSQSRLEIYLTAIDKASLESTEQKVAKMLELLPHTPIAGFGINFFFEIKNPPDDLQHKIRAGDGLSDVIQISREELSSRCDIEPRVQLNIQRISETSLVSFNFNYHHSEAEAETIISKIAGGIERRLDQSTGILRDCYNLSHYDVSPPDLPQDMDNAHDA